MFTEHWKIRVFDRQFMEVDNFPQLIRQHTDAQLQHIAFVCLAFLGILRYHRDAQPWLCLVALAGKKICSYPPVIKHGSENPPFSLICFFPF